MSGLGRIPHLDSDQQLRGRLASRIRLLLDDRPLTFEQILVRSLNCDPSNVQSVLSEAFATGEVRQREDSVNGVQYCCSAVRKKRPDVRDRDEVDAIDGLNGMPADEKDVVSRAKAILNAVPDPSPVYGQWWFSPDCYAPLLRWLRGEVFGAAPVAFLGAPTLGTLFSQEAAQRVGVLDIDTEVLSSLSAQLGPTGEQIRYDASSPVSADCRGKFGFVFCDPPWGRESLRRFLVRCSELVAEGCQVAFSIPQRLTRPGFTREMTELSLLAESLGLRPSGLFRNGTSYGVPAFERKAYGSHGITFTRSWRRGDLVVYRKSRPASGNQGFLADAPVAAWSQWLFGRKRLFVRAKSRALRENPVIRPVAGATELLCTTTSSRNRVLSQASVVSTNNYFGCVESPEGLFGVLSSEISRIRNSFHKIESIQGWADPLLVVNAMLSSSDSAFSGG